MVLAFTATGILIGKAVGHLHRQSRSNAQAVAIFCALKRQTTTSIRVEEEYLLSHPDARIVSFVLRDLASDRKFLHILNTHLTCGKEVNP